MITTKELYTRCRQTLGLQLLTEEEGLLRAIEVPEVHRPGLSLAGYSKHFVYDAFFVFGHIEIEYLRDLSPSLRKERLAEILRPGTQGVFITRERTPPLEIISLCQERKIPLFLAKVGTQALIGALSFFLNEETAPTLSLPATLVETYGVGVMIEGDAGVGKSEAALALIKRGHRLVADDVVRIRAKQEQSLIGSAPESLRHLLAIRGVGILDIAHLYGAVAACDFTKIDLIVKLVRWDEEKSYDTVDEKELLSIRVPYRLLPVTPGRDVALLIETLALQHRLKKMGIDSGHTVQEKLHKRIAEKVTRSVHVQNRLGLHARPAAAIVKLLQPFEGDVFLSSGREEVNARSVLNILQLAASQGEEITITAVGKQAEEIVCVLEEAFASRFGEQR